MKSKVLLTASIILMGFHVIVSGILIVTLLSIDLIQPELQETTPEEVVAKMFENMEKVKTVHYESESMLNGGLLPEGVGSAMAAIVRGDSYIDFSNSSFKRTMYFKMEFKDEKEERPVLMEMEVDNIVIEGVVFVNYRKMNYDPPTNDMPPENQWIKTEEEYPLSFLGAVPRSEAIEKFLKEGKNTITKAKPLIENIRGKEVYHYIVNVKETPQAECDIYIGKKDYLPYRMSCELEDPDGLTSIKVEFYEYNKPLDIRTPEDYITIEELEEILNYGPSDKEE